MDTPAVPPPHDAVGPVRRFDDAVDAWFDRRLRGRTLPDRIFYTASELGDFSLIWHLLGTVRALRRDGDVAEAVRISALLGIESALINGPVKSLFRRERPVHEVARPHRLRTPRTSSFPSGHASAAAVFAVVASEDDPWAPAYVAAAALVASSRVHVRIHHASDVLGGAIVGTALGLVLRRWWPAGQALPRGLPRRER